MVLIRVIHQKEIPTAFLFFFVFVIMRLFYVQVLWPELSKFPEEVQNPNEFSIKYWRETQIITCLKYGNLWELVC